MKHVLFYIAFGPEVRAFLHSGLISQLSAGFSVSIVTHHPASRAFSDCRYETLTAPDVSESHLLMRVRNLSAKVHERCMISFGYERWQHYLAHEISPLGLSDRVGRFVANMTSGVSAIEHVELCAGKLWGTEPSWSDFFRTHQVDMLVYSANGQKKTVAAEQTARNLGIKRVLIPNSWKDPFVKPGLAVQPDRLLVWDEATARLYHDINPTLSPDCVKATGSLHMHAILNAAGQIPRAEFCELFGLDPDRPIICYTTAAPNAVVGEEILVKEFADGLAQQSGSKSPQLLVRINPMEEGRRFEDALQGMDGVVVQRPLWEWQRSIDWCCALPDDTRLWAAMIEHCHLNVSIPSTVTLEFLAFGKPVINVCFDVATVSAAQSNLRFWRAPFYAGVRNLPGVSDACSLDELLSKVVDMVKSPSAELSEVIRPHSSTVENTAHAICKVMGGK